MRTKQELFNIAVTGLARQGWKHSANNGYGSACLYRGPNGLKCAAGHLIPDNLYDKRMEACGITKASFADGRLVYLLKAIPELEDAATFGFVTKMQQLHDRSPSPREMCDAFRSLSVTEGLEWPLE